MNCLKCQLPIEKASPSDYGLHPSCFTEWFGASSTTPFLGLQKRTRTTSDPAPSVTSQNTSFFHGKFRKYSATLDGHSYILKMRQKEEAPELPEVEYLCNQIGELCGVPVAKFYFINFHGDQTFVTKNFITTGMLADLQHLYHFRSDEQHSCQEIIRVIKEQTHSPRDVAIFVKTVLFDALIGNHDRHGRNLAFIITTKGSELSPIYDNVSYLSLEKGQMLKADFNPTGKISTRNTSEPSMRDYVKELKHLGYDQDVAAFYQGIKIQKIFQLVDESFCSSLMKQAITALIKKRYKELEDELSH